MRKAPKYPFLHKGMGIETPGTVIAPLKDFRAAAVMTIHTSLPD
jgi:hypothetical protein